MTIWQWCTICEKQFHSRCDRCGGLKHGIDYAINHIKTEYVKELTERDVWDFIETFTLSERLHEAINKSEIPLIKSSKKCPAT